MADELREQIREFVAIAQECPDNLQEKCFELLLCDFLERRRLSKAPPATVRPPRPGEDSTQVEEQSEVLKEVGAQQDLKLTDIHMKVRKFLHKYSLCLEDLNELFYKENNEIKPLYEDLKTTRIAEGQIRITLLQALMAAIRNGDFEANGEDVRVECQLRKSYDPANFAANLKNNANLFEDFESYKKGVPLRLSEDGRKELSELIKELAK